MKRLLALGAGYRSRRPDHAHARELDAHQRRRADLPRLAALPRPASPSMADGTIWEWMHRLLAFVVAPLVIALVVVAWRQRNRSPFIDAHGRGSSPSSSSFKCCSARRRFVWPIRRSRWCCTGPRQWRSSRRSRRWRSLPRRRGVGQNRHVEAPGVSMLLAVMLGMTRVRRLS